MTDLIRCESEEKSLNEIKVQILIAQQAPRDEVMAIQSITRSMDRPSFAESAIYSYPRGGTIVQGPSVKLAREIARLWGHIRYGFKIVNDTLENRAIEGFAWDMQTNTNISYQASFSKLVQKKIWEDKKHVRTDWVPADERELRELTNKHGAILSRNCVLQLIPADIVDDFVQKSVESQKAIKLDAGKLEEAIKKAVDGFVKWGISTQNLELFLRTPKAGWGSDSLVELRGLYSAIKDGLVGIDEFKEKTKPAEGSFLSLDSFLSQVKEVKEVKEDKDV